MDNTPPIPRARGYPEMITVDNGPELRGRALDGWAYDHGVELYFIDPGKPTQNAYIESFNGRFREECLNLNWFTTLAEAQSIIENWRIDYNQNRPHLSLKYLTPEEFAANRPFHKPQYSGKQKRNRVYLLMVLITGAGQSGYPNYIHLPLTVRIGGLLL